MQKKLTKFTIYLFFKKPLNKVDIYETYLHIIKAIHIMRATASINKRPPYPRVNKAENFPLSSDTRQRCPLSHQFIQHCVQSASLSNWGREKKQVRAIQIGKQEVKLSLFVDGIIILKNP